jgi:hypothetical protein
MATLLSIVVISYYIRFKSSIYEKKDKTIN